MERNRSRFVAEAVRNELARRQQVELQRSLARPHPETAELPEIGLDDWGPDPPGDDDALVDAAAGVAIRWDAGWREEPT